MSKEATWHEEMKPVRIIWGDSVGAAEGWMDEGLVAQYIVKMKEDGLSVETIGFIEYEDDNLLIIAQSRHGKNRHNMLTIPKVSIKNMCTVKWEEAPSGILEWQS